MKATYISGQKFVQITYTNYGAHAPTDTWYPIENLRYLRAICDVKLA